MSMNATPGAQRLHIGIFGRRNAGKSSVINAVTGQSLAIVSPTAGTTTDPVRKAMELLPLGPVVLIDTPGLDDEGELGALRVQKAREVLDETDLALLVCDCTVPRGPTEQALLAELEERKIPYLIVENKCDLLEEIPAGEERTVYVSAARGTNLFELKERMAALRPEETGRRIIGDLLAPGDLCVLVVPIDKAAPKGRLILPQQQTIRDILDAGAVAVVTRDTELQDTLAALGQRKPRIVITDSQAFARVNADTPAEVPLTSFSILMIRYKGDLPTVVRGADALDTLEDGDRVLISEGCTHHRQCEDIGTVKIPAAIRKYTGRQPEFCFTSGGEFPRDLSPYKLIVHCGGCTLNEQAMRSRLNRAVIQGTPITNYGVLLAKVNGILDRSLEPFPEL